MTWILGAPDPEMGRIEALLLKYEQDVQHASVGGARVHPGNAYKADPVALLGEQTVVLVECVPARGFAGGYMR